MTPERDSELRDLLTRSIVTPADVIQEYKNGVYTLHERIEKLEAENKRLREQARCGHSPWPCQCDYRGKEFRP